MVPTFAMAALDMVLGVAYYGDHRWSAMDADPTRRKPWSAPSARSRPKGSWSASPARSRTPLTRFRTATMCGSPPRPPWTWRLRWPGSFERPWKRSDGCGGKWRRSPRVKVRTRSHAGNWFDEVKGRGVAAEAGPVTNPKGAGERRPHFGNKAEARPLRGWGMPLGMGRDGGRDALLQDFESNEWTGDGGVRGRGRGGRPRRPGAGRGLPRPRPCLRGGPRGRGRAAGGGGEEGGGRDRMTTHRDTTLALIRALHRGATMPELEIGRASRR